MLKLIMAYKYAARQPISSMMLLCQLTELSNCCHCKISFARPSVISALDIPTDFSRLVLVQKLQRQWQFQTPTGELMTRPVYVIPVLVAAYEQPEVVLACVTNPSISSNNPTKPRLSMSQASQTIIMDATFHRLANAGDRAYTLKSVDIQPT